MLAAHNLALYAAGGFAALLVFPGPARPGEIPEIDPAVRCSAPESLDQDDMCVWRDDRDPARSTVIASDKEAGRLFVYDLSGRVIQSLATPKPGNIDCRPGFPLNGKSVDLVIHNQRDAGWRLVAYKVDPESRRLERIDNGNIATGENYGGTLYRSPKTGRFYFISTSETGTIEQYELSDDGTGKVAGKKVRSWSVGGQCEGAVADDNTGTLYIGDEAKGVWAVGGEPDDPVPGRLVIRVGENDLEGDVEGLALVPQQSGSGHLVVSDQGAGCFRVYRRGEEYEYAGAFSIKGAGDTDGIEIVAAGLGQRFPAGLFACHTDQGDRPLMLTGWPPIAEALGIGRPLRTRQ